MYQNDGKGMATASLVCGIIACVLGALPFVGIVLGIIGIVTGSKGKKLMMMANLPAGMATAGFVLSIIGLCYGAIGTIVCLSLSGCCGCTSCCALNPYLYY